MNSTYAQIWLLLSIPYSLLLLKNSWGFSVAKGQYTFLFAEQFSKHPYNLLSVFPDATSQSAMEFISNIKF